MLHPIDLLDKRTMLICHLIVTTCMYTHGKKDGWHQEPGASLM